MFNPVQVCGGECFIEGVLSSVLVCERLEMWCARILKVLDIASVCDITRVSAILYLFKV